MQATFKVVTLLKNPGLQKMQDLAAGVPTYSPSPHPLHFPLCVCSGWKKPGEHAEQFPHALVLMQCFPAGHAVAADVAADVAANSGSARSQTILLPCC
jgi:hypothetical protein